MPPPPPTDPPGAPPQSPLLNPPPPMPPPPPPQGASGQQLVGGVVGVQNRGVAPPRVHSNAVFCDDVRKSERLSVLGQHSCPSLGYCTPQRHAWPGTAGEQGVPPLIARFREGVVHAPVCIGPPCRSPLKFRAA